MIDHPILTQDVTPEVYKFRDEDPTRFLGPAAIKISSFKNERQRIEVSYLTSTIEISYAIYYRSLFLSNTII